MNKTILMSVAVILGLAVLVAGFFYFRTMPASSPPGSVTSTFPISQSQTSTLPISSPPVAGSSGSIFSIPTPQGAVTIKNFYQSATLVTASGSEVLVTRTPGYDISYYQPDNSFVISISQKPVMATRAQAEAAFLQQLGISQADACKLKVMVSVPVSVDEQYAGTNLGLSFCK
jgi:hypothetical protein